mmetsp:Transcript_27356/g.35448  ORF Transcript_27356/g.35448 Transcript_27356/m.35448 type:complete len:629 (-) Transcript_27356:456-2342(-)
MSSKIRIESTPQPIETFWEARETSRKILIFIELIFTILVAALDIKESITPVALCMMVCLMFFGSNYLGIKTSRKVYDGLIVFFSCSVAHIVFQITKRDMNNISDIKLHNGDYFIIKELNQGRIPFSILYCNILPLIATSTGMSIEVAKYVVIYNLFAFIIVASNVYHVVECPHYSCNIDISDRRLNFYCDVIMFSVIFSLTWFCCLPAIEIGNDYIRTKEVDAKADAMLSNVLKNSIAGASCLIEIEQEEMKANPCEKCGIRHRLTQARHQLLHSMRWCMSRQVMVELASGTYKTYLSDFNLNNFFIDMNVMSENNKIIFEDITGISDRYLLKLDENMVHVAIENGLFSASSHGTGNIKLETFIIDNDKKNSQKCLQFKISNSIPESVLENITSEKGKEFNKKLQKHAERARQHGSRPTNTLTLATVNSSAGLHRISVAVTGAGGSFDIRYDEITSKVILTINIPVELSPVPLVSFVSESESDFKPSENSDKVENNNVVVDGNEALNKGSSKNEVQKTSKILSINTKNLSSSSSSSLSSSKPKKAVHNNGDESPKTPKLTFPANLTICAIDDSKIICKGYERLLLPLLKCDSKSSLVTCPKSKEDIRQFLEVVLPWYNNNINILMVVI